MRAVSSLRSRSSDGQRLEQVDGPRQQPGGLGVRAASLLRLRGDEVEAGGALGGAREVQVLRDECRLRAGGRCLRDVGVRRRRTSSTCVS